MEHIYDTPFCNMFRCDGDINFHDYYYVAPAPVDEQALVYQVHRAGIEHRLPKVFEVMRDSSAGFVHIFCILSGCGYLEYGNRQYRLRQNQIVLLPAHEAHRYWCDSRDPMGKVWMEICGGDVDRIVRYLLCRHGPVVEGELFFRVCAQICLIQQRLMVDAHYRPSLEIYRVLYTMLSGSEDVSPRIREDSRANFMLAEAYINAHLSRKITNKELSDVCGISLQHFLKLFKESYGVTPQEFIMQQRLTKAQYALLHSDRSIVSISEACGFCDASHFFRRFSEKYGMTPAQYKKTYTAEDAE